MTTKTELRTLTHKRIFEARDTTRNAADDGTQYSMLIEIANDMADDILTLLEDTVREARRDELKKLLHKNVCEVMCGWSKKCDLQGEDCPKIRKRLVELKDQHESYKMRWWEK